jgi:hypothetical protein
VKRLIAYMLLLAATGYGAAEIAQRYSEDSKTNDLLRTRTQRIEEQMSLEAERK